MALPPTVFSQELLALVILFEQKRGRKWHTISSRHQNDTYQDKSKTSSHRHLNDTKKKILTLMSNTTKRLCKKIDSVTLTLTQAHTSKASFITPKRREIIGCYSNGEKHEVYCSKGLHTPVHRSRRLLPARDSAQGVRHLAAEPRDLSAQCWAPFVQPKIG